LRMDFQEPTNGQIVVVSDEDMKVSNTQFSDTPVDAIEPNKNEEMKSAEYYFKEAKEFRVGGTCQRRLSGRCIEVKEKKQFAKEEKKRERRFNRDVQSVGEALASTPLARDDPKLVELWTRLSKSGEGINQVPLSSLFLNSIQTFIRGLDPHWASIRIALVMGNSDKNKKWIHIWPEFPYKTEKLPAARYCMNKG